MDLSAVKKKWGTEKKPVKKSPAKKQVSNKTVKKTEKQSESGNEKKETIPPSAVPVKKKRPPINTEYDDPEDAPSNLDDLMNKAQEAKLEEQISKARLAEYKVEREKLALDLQAGNIAEVPYMEFVYISHIDRMYTDLLRMIDKVTPKLSPFIQDKDEDGAIKLLKKEVIDTIRNVKQGQKEALKSWKKDLKG